MLARHGVDPVNNTERQMMDMSVRGTDALSTKGVGQEKLLPSDSTLNECLALGQRTS